MRTLPAVLLLLAAGLARAERITLPLDGEWQIEDGKDPGAVPSSWRHTVPVPGLANLARPAFPDVDRFDSNETIARRIRSGRLPQSALVHHAGIPRQDRNWLWYRRTFRVPARKAVAIL